MAEQIRCSRSKVFKSGIFVVLLFTAVNLVMYMVYEHIGIYGINRRLNNLLITSENASHEVKEIIRQFNGSMQLRTNVYSNTSRSSLPERTNTYSNTSRGSLPVCPDVSPKLVGPLATYKKSPSIPEIEKEYSWLLAGGCYSPVECRSDHRVAVIIPYRNRHDQLKTFLYNIHPFLQRQQIHYGIYVIEQAGNNTFNRALLMNVGYAESVKIYRYNCFVFHDVDLIPEDDRIQYGCGKQPRHLSAAIDKFQYRLPYKSIFGGVSQLSKDAFVKINGFSNKYFGWGGEDDDIHIRLRTEGYTVERYPMTIARYKMIKHNHENSNSQNPNRWQLLQQATKRYKTDGLNSLKYKVLNITYNKLYTLVSVDVKQSDYDK